MLDLKAVFEQCPNCLSSRVTFRSVLMDKYPAEKQTINILTILYDCGILEKISRKNNISNTEIHNLITQLENEYGISGEYSNAALLMVMAAYGIIASPVSIPTSTPPDTLEYGPPKQEQLEASECTLPEDIKYVRGDNKDYDISQRSDGYYIIHFNGFEEEELTIPTLIDGKRIKGIAQDVFQGCRKIRSVYISEGIEIIENGVFYGCTSLKSVSLPKTLRKIGCDISTQNGKHSVKQDDGVFAFTGLESIVIPENVDFIGPYAFSMCTKLKSVMLPDYVTRICESTFSYCESLVNVKFPKNLFVIEPKAFIKCEKLREVHIPIGTTKIGKGAFNTTGLIAAYIPPTVIKIGEDDTNSIVKDNTFLGNYRGIMTIYCEAGSVAMDYARKHNYHYAKAQF